MPLVYEQACKDAPRESLSAAQEQHQQACYAAFLTPGTLCQSLNHQMRIQILFPCHAGVHQVSTQPVRFSSKYRNFRNQNYETHGQKGIKNTNFETKFNYHYFILKTRQKTFFLLVQILSSVCGYVQRILKVPLDETSGTSTTKRLENVHYINIYYCKQKGVIYQESHVIYMGGGANKQKRKSKPAEYLKRSLAEKSAGLVVNKYQSEYFPVLLNSHSTCPCFAYAAQYCQKPVKERHHIYKKLKLSLKRNQFFQIK